MLLHPQEKPRFGGAFHLARLVSLISQEALHNNQQGLFL